MASCFLIHTALWLTSVLYLTSSVFTTDLTEEPTTYYTNTFAVHLHDCLAEEEVDAIAESVGHINHGKVYRRISWNISQLCVILL